MLQAFFTGLALVFLALAVLLLLVKAVQPAIPDLRVALDSGVGPGCGHAWVILACSTLLALLSMLT